MLVALQQFKIYFSLRFINISTVHGALSLSTDVHGKNMGTSELLLCYEESSGTIIVKKLFVVVVVVVYFILSWLLYLAFSANLGLL